MRIGILGKGGSGKTTLSAALIKYFALKKYNVLGVDADQNVNLASTLNANFSVNLSDHSKDVLDYFHMLRDDLKGFPLIGSIPPSNNSRFIRLNENDAFLKNYSKNTGFAYLIQAGSYTVNDVGVSCYHGKQEVLEAIYNHLLDTKKDIIITDLTAGVDSVGNSMYLVHDVLFFVLEPSNKSVDVFLNFKKITIGLNLKIKVIVNKLRTKEDMLFLKNKINDLDDYMLASFSDDALIHDVEKGLFDALDNFVLKYVEEFNKIENYTKTVERDWGAYFKRIVEHHKKSCLAWHDSFYGEKISKLIDVDFSYEQVLGDNNDDSA